ncbi:hypothetical protein MCOR03_000533 [Pyricularia oryzae]|uniref:Cyanovirin-N domain-containing protein n=1 Tax=Pyricularia grisea TaxID=148305 RepID=A0ABQ8NP74_PYRGI|nr:hypothetical protein MCOR19_003022 [Pyricularia oryzae]KAI6299178.1 hypothetical protein MCOR33_004826 [Pyricularia grisea]KAI6460637.1 hypothetical protein MCOR15_005385 [Pyricularia oryzae]KAI6507616.1 hypothetical protein MCOR13_002707 [Pyricularia oryzae]KAI6568277.1 hypothetical protein MCOR03_000533 [Pyricularia oryzae]
MHMSKALVLALVGSINAAADFDLTCGNIVAKGTTLRADCGGPTTTLDLNQCLTVKDDGTVECGKGGLTIRVQFHWRWVGPIFKGSLLH